MLQAEDVVNHSTLNRLKDFTREFGNIEGIDRCISPFDAQDISIEDGFILMEPLLDSIPSKPSDYKFLTS